MFKILSRLTLLFLLSFTFKSNSTQLVAVGPHVVAAGEYIVKLKKQPGIFTYGKRGFLGKDSLRLARRLSERDGLYLTKDDRGVMDSQVLEKLSKDPDVEFVEPNYVYFANFGSRKPRPGPPPPFLPVPDPEDPPPSPPPANPDPGPGPTPLPPAEDPNTVISNDAYLGNQWGLHNPGGASAKVSHAWKLETGDDVVVAVVDSGVDYNHRDLKANMWSKNHEGSTVYGYNAISNDHNPMDDNMHGTHVAGSIGAVSNNGIGVAGVNWRTRLMALKFLGSSGSGTTADAIEAIDWARENGAQVINMSWGGGGFSQALYDALGRAEAAGIVLVAASGNEGNNNDRSPSYPANYDIPSMLTVGASDSQDRMANFSNYGRNSVDLLAPGVGILSTIPGNGYRYLDGTSMAAPHVAGAAALLLSYAGSLSPSEVKQRIMDSVDVVSGARNTISGGRLNVDVMLRQ